MKKNFIKSGLVIALYVGICTSLSACVVAPPRVVTYRAVPVVMPAPVAVVTPTPVATVATPSPSGAVVVQQPVVVQPPVAYIRPTVYARPIAPVVVMRPRYYPPVYVTPVL